MPVTATDVTRWVNALSMLVSLGVPIVNVVMMVRRELSGPDADAVLRSLLSGWAAAKTENDARISELQATVKT